MDSVLNSASDHSMNETYARTSDTGGNYTTTSRPSTTTDWLDAIINKQWHEEDFLGRFLTYTVSEGVRRYLPLIFVLIGTVGNLLCIIVLLRPRMRKKSMFAFLTVLAVADTVVLYILPFRIWIGMMTDDAYAKDATLCKVSTYLTYVASEFSAGVLTLVTVERFIVVQNPLRGPLICNVRRAYIAMAILLVVLCVLHAHLLWTFDTRHIFLHGYNMSSCRAAEGYETLVDIVWPWVDICLYSLIPFIVILTLNILIIRKTKGAAGKRRQLMSQTSITSNSQDESSRLTFMLLIVTFTFLVTTLPLSLASMAIALRIPYTSTHNSAAHQELASQYLARSLTQVLMFINHSTNFFLYCLTGNKFRQELKLAMCCKDAPKKRGSLSSTFTTGLSGSFKDNNRIVRPGQPGKLSLQMNRLC